MYMCFLPHAHQGPSTKGLSSPCSPHAVKAACAHVGLGHPQLQSHSPSTRWAKALGIHSAYGLKKCSSAPPRLFPTGIILMETASETFLFVAPNPFIICKTNSLVSCAKPSPFCCSSCFFCHAPAPTDLSSG